MPNARKLNFYTTAGCHLCEEAAQMLAELEFQHSIEWEAIDIAEDEDLVELYGIRIPVILNTATGKEIGWPFEYEDLLRMI